MNKRHRCCAGSVTSEKGRAVLLPERGEAGRPPRQGGACSRPPMDTGSCGRKVGIYELVIWNSVFSCGSAVINGGSAVKPIFLLMALGHSTRLCHSRSDQCFHGGNAAFRPGPLPSWPSPRCSRPSSCGDGCFVQQGQPGACPVGGEGLSTRRVPMAAAQLQVGSRFSTFLCFRHPGDWPTNLLSCCDCPQLLPPTRNTSMLVS